MISVAKSDLPQAFDALPALKVRHYNGEMKAGKIYTVAQMYVLRESLALRLNVFEKSPANTSAVGFCLASDTDNTLVLRLFPNEVQLQLCGKNKTEELKAPAVSYHSGGDEQGFYWGADVQIPPSLLQLVGLALKNDSTFLANLFKLDCEEDAFGAAFPVLQDTPPYSPANCGHFKVVNFTTAS